MCCIILDSRKLIGKYQNQMNTILDKEYERNPILNEMMVLTERDNEFIISFKNNSFHLKISYKLKELLSFVDGNRSFKEITSAYNSMFNCKLDVPLVYELLNKKLGRYNIVESEVKKVNANKSPNYLKLNQIVLKEEIVEKISKPLSFLFKKKVSITLIIVCVISIGTILTIKHDTIFKTFDNIATEYLVFYIFLMMLSGFVHELGHTSATHSFGSKSGGIGFGFYLLTPVLYADVTNAWKLKRNQRIVVNLSGIYFELIYGTVLTGLLLVFGYGPTYIIPLIIIFKTLFNLNPFFRSDGYWVVSDLINVSNLRDVSNKVFYKIIKQGNIIACPFSFQSL
jgi:putative peptide zinc metalloprotease protein